MCFYAYIAILFLEMEKKHDTTSSEVNELALWQFKSILKSLEDARGSGTSMVSLYIPAKTQL